MCFHTTIRYTLLLQQLESSNRIETISLVSTKKINYIYKLFFTSNLLIDIKIYNFYLK